MRRRASSVKQVKCDKKVVLFGELMMRLSTKRHERIVQAREFDVIYSGAEANLGVALQALGIDSYMVSSVPDNAVGEACLCYLRQFQLNLDHVRKNGDRLGIYFVETGAAQRPSTFLYNRKGSSITELRPGDLDWDAIFAGKHWFHFTGITPALADSVADITREACAAAKQQRADRQLRPELPPKTLVAGESPRGDDRLDAVRRRPVHERRGGGDRLRHPGAGDQRPGGQISTAGYEDVAAQLHDKFQLEYVSISLRGSISATANDWSGMLYDGRQLLHQPQVPHRLHRRSRRRRRRLFVRHHLRPADRPGLAGDGRFRRGRLLPETLDPRRFQPREFRRNPRPDGRRRQRQNPTLNVTSRSA